MRTPICLALLAVLVGACTYRPTAPPSQAAIAPSPARTGAAVGITSRVFEDDARDRKLVTTIWYPAAAGSPQHEIEWDGIFIGHGAWDVPLRPTPRRFPIVLLSHGSGADGASLGWLAEKLAAHGYVAIAVDHPGDRFGDSSQVGRFAAWRRPPDVRVVLDRVLDDPALGPRLDRMRIAAAGHSSGAYTMLALAGARLKPQAYLAYCGSPARGPDCKLFDDLDATHIPDLSEAGKSARDPRIRAVLALSPVLGPGIDTASLRKVTVPVVIVASPTDSVVPFDRNAARYGRFIRGDRIVEIPKADHFVFMPMCTLPGRIVAAQVCVDAHGVDRQAIHDKVSALALALFDRHLGIRASERRRPRR